MEWKCIRQTDNWINFVTLKRWNKNLKSAGEVLGDPDFVGRRPACHVDNILDASSRQWIWESRRRIRLLMTINQNNF